MIEGGGGCTHVDLSAEEDERLDDNIGSSDHLLLTGSVRKLLEDGRKGLGDLGSKGQLLGLALTVDEGGGNREEKDWDHDGWRETRSNGVRRDEGEGKKERKDKPNM